MRTALQRKIRTNGALLLIVASTFLFYAYSTGITGVTKKNGNGCECHNASPTSSVIVTINGPDTVLVNDTVTFSVTITGGTLTRGGTNIAASSGILVPGSGMQKIGEEITHILPKAPAGGIVTFDFSYVAPLTEGVQTLYANGNSVNFNGQETGDQWNFANNKTIQVVHEVVPVELSAFSAFVEKNNVNLKWSTATEVNNQGFEIERQVFSPQSAVSNPKFEIRNSKWDLVGFVKGAGNSTERKEYSFTDKNLSAGKYTYRLKQTDLDGSFKFYNLSQDIEINTPQLFTLNQNYPNPFNPSTSISFVIPYAGNVELIIYNSTGEELELLVNEFKEPGAYAYNFNASDYSSGVYYYKLNFTGGEASFKEVKKMLLIK